MDIGGSLLLIAVGAILKYGVTTQPAGFRFDTIGTILMVVGAIGVVIMTLLRMNHGTQRKTIQRDIDGNPSVIEKENY